MNRFLIFLPLLFGLMIDSAYAQTAGVKTVPVDSGWAANSINTVSFRKSALTTFKHTQFIAYYNAGGYVMLGKRRLGSHHWQLEQTPYKGNVTDAHNAISIAVDGDGFLHLAWDHHNNALRYAKSVAPLSFKLTDKISMTGSLEAAISYPEFYNLPNGNLLFLYRDGSSGSGNLVMNRYDVRSKKWRQLHANLIDGEGARNAYWQACTDSKGAIHLSWVWRESPDVASNHDMAYARSDDGGTTWQKSTGETYTLPITAATAEYACRIPQGSELINQTSITADAEGHPFIATYWRDSGTLIPQYHLIYKKEKDWQVGNLGFRKTAFSLSGAGTKRIPIARPQVVVWEEKSNTAVAFIFRDEERGSAISAAINMDADLQNWKVIDLIKEDVGSWEPSYDITLWNSRKRLHLFVQKTAQADSEGLTRLPPQVVSVLEWRRAKK